MERDRLYKNQRRREQRERGVRENRKKEIKRQMKCWQTEEDVNEGKRKTTKRESDQQRTYIQKLINAQHSSLADNYYCM